MRLFSILSIALTCTLSAYAADWPVALRDNARSGVSPEVLDTPLHLQWSYRAALPPSPAWPPPAKQDFWQELQGLRHRVAFDQAFVPVAADGEVIFGSSSEDWVMARDLKLGRERWRFYTEGTGAVRARAARRARVLRQ